MLLVLAIALVAATASSYGIYRALTRASTSTPYDMAQVVVAAKPLPAGTRVESDAVKLVQWPTDAKPGSGFDSIEAVVGRGLISAVSENEPLTETKLAPTDAGAGLPLLIPTGMRAMSVKVDEVVGVAGFVVPGTRVDVLAIMGRAEESSARTVVSNVEILTAGEHFERNEGDGKPIRSSVVTLLVTADDAQRVALVQAEGRIMLSLRNHFDRDRPALEPVAAAALFGLPGAPAEVPRPPPAVIARPSPRPVAAPKSYVVEAYRATQRSSESLR
jgi:pilus assembly protein CpaB